MLVKSIIILDRCFTGINKSRIGTGATCSALNLGIYLYGVVFGLSKLLRITCEGVL